ncbi:MAG: hypothetical protein EPN97_01780 [Alphaproteobacteria bacterium]|nr:MAG: hypothetical protein EPN97_01780 [Alphaproteobacteria bacterium]
MIKSGRFKTVFIALAFVCFIFAGFMSVNVMTSCQSEAQCTTCGNLCIGVPGLAFTMNALINGTVVFPDIAIVIATLSLYMDIALLGFELAIDEKIFEVTQNITAWIDTFWWYNLRPALQAMTEQLNTFDSFQDENQGGFADSNDANRLDAEYMTRTIESHRQQRPGENVCVAGTISGGMTRTSVFRRAYETAATIERHPRTGNDTSAATGSPSNVSMAADQLSRWEKYTTTYCNQNYNAGYSGCTANQAQVDRDIAVTDEIFAKDTIDLKTPATQKAIDDILENIAEPEINDTVPPSALGGAQGQEAVLAGQAYKAKRQVVYDALYYVVSRRAPGTVGTTGSPNFLQDMRTAAGIDPSYFSPNPSHNEIMEVMMSERFRTGQYSIEQVDEPENNEREMVVQQAFQAMLLSDQLDLLDRYGLILAAQASGEIKAAKPFSPAADATVQRP